MFTLVSDTLCSMGGAIAVRAAASGVIPSLVGIAVIDVVEGKNNIYQQVHMHHAWYQSSLTVKECLFPTQDMCSNSYYMGKQERIRTGD